MKTNRNEISGILLFIGLLAILALAGYGAKKNNARANPDKPEQVSENKQFVCSMHPDVIRNGPGDCPICGMFLIEMVSQDKNSFDSLLTDIVRSVNQSVFGSVRTIPVEKKSVVIEIDASGIINYDPRKIQTISARFGGLIERSFVKYQFQHIKKGQKIYEIYSPDIYTERWNYVRLIQAYPDRDDLTAEALEWFRLLGLSEGQIDSLKHCVKPDYYLAVYSFADGYAVSKDFDPETFFITGPEEGNDPETFLAGTGSIGLTDGITVETGESLFKLIDIRSLRVDLKVKTDFGSLLRKGQKVTISDAANPGKQFITTIDQIEPLNGGLFQSVRVYITDNESLLLPGRKIVAKINAGTREGLWIPVSAVIDLGQRNSVFVMNENKFIATEVRTGIRCGDKIEVISGLDENSIVAEKALLLVDSDGLISLK